MKTIQTSSTCSPWKSFDAPAWLCAAFCAVWLFTPSLLSAQDFVLDSFALAAGGGESSGGDFELSATIGQTDAGNLLGGDFTFIGGFWGIVTTVETPGAPSLSVSLAAGALTISWPDSGSVDFFLEETAALADPSTWAPVNANVQTSNGVKSVSLSRPTGNHFYRLHKP